MSPSDTPDRTKRYGPPVLMVQERTLPEAWEAAILQLAAQSIGIATEYDPGEQSLDTVMIMVVKEPFTEPRVHSGAAVGSLAFYDEYVAEILDGVNDEEVFTGKLSYTYHQRLFDYTIEDSFNRPELKGTGVNQLAYVIQKLSSASYSRRAQAITWNPVADPSRDDPPCLQRLWFRIYKNGDDHFLAMHSHWRSRDALHAAFLNMYALTLLQERITRLISEQLGLNIQVGQYVDISDSFHVYERTREDLQRFLRTAKTLSPEQKYWTTKKLRSLIDQTGSSAKQ